ncbi:ABC transporter permease [Clostridium gasigenes]|uniref:ABC transporter permease n=1 Tax=Clostridium gasigenes TaxID=94869 RepID=UPI001C0C3761|nr:ABC transporter permease [Clostridium gasigenes]MBU3090269.1 ABC transporter permease [Clostridium gasigenes]
MEAFMYNVGLQWKLDFRNKGILLVYYIIPLVFFLFMGGVFSSINPESKNTLIQSMSIFTVTMAAVMGSQTPLINLYRSETKKVYKVGNIPLWVAAVSNFISAFIHISISFIIIFAIAPIIFKAKISDNVLVYFILLVLCIITSLLIGTILGLLIKNTSKLTMISQLVFLPSIMLSGIMFDSALLPKVFQKVSEILPATQSMKLMTSSYIDFKLMLPIILITIALIIVTGILLRKISVE